MRRGGGGAGCGRGSALDRGVGTRGRMQRAASVAMRVGTVGDGVGFVGVPGRRDVLCGWGAGEAGRVDGCK